MTREESFARFIVVAAIAVVILSQMVGCERDRQRWLSIGRAVDRGAAVTMEGDRVSVLPRAPEESH